MPHNFETREIDYNEEHPPEWATPEEKIKFHPRRAAMFMCAEIDRVEKLFAERKAAEEAETKNK